MIILTTYTTYRVVVSLLRRPVDVERSRYVDDMLGEFEVGELGRRRGRRRDPLVQDLAFALKAELGTPAKSAAMDRLIRDKALRALDAKEGFRNHQRHATVTRVMTLVYLKSDVELEETAVSTCSAAQQRGRDASF